MPDPIPAPPASPSADASQATSAPADIFGDYILKERAKEDASRARDLSATLVIAALKKDGPRYASGYFFELNPQGGIRHVPAGTPSST